MRRLLQHLGACAAVAAAVVAAWQEWWPFDASPEVLSSYDKPSVWQFLFSDRLTLGFARLGLAALVMYLAASVPALIVGGRWLRGFGTSGVTADDAVEARETLEDLENEVERLTGDLGAASSEIDALRNQRDRLISMLRRVVRSSTQSATMPITSPMMGEQKEEDEHPGTRDNQEDAS